jgi:hypothetical protein
MVFFALVAAALFVAGISFGIKAPLVVQLAAFLGGVAWLRSEKVRRMEIAALFPIVLFAVAVAGVVGGDVYYLVRFAPAAGGFSLGEAVAWLFRP